jgi:preprotein translocase subunit SecE
MARNRQRAKQRQAERRARRLAEQGDGDAQLIDDPTAVDPSPAVPPDLAVGAPPTDEGRSDTVIEDEPPLLEDERALDEDEARLDEDEVRLDEDDVRLDAEEAPLDQDEALEEIEDWELEDEPTETPTGAGEAGYEVRGRRGRAEAEAHKDRPRVVQFLIAVWAELQRVQWPNRQALVTLTGVVLGFVLIAGGYLGLLDAIFSELIQAIL